MVLDQQCQHHPEPLRRVDSHPTTGPPCWRVWGRHSAPETGDMAGRPRPVLSCQLTCAGIPAPPVLLPLSGRPEVLGFELPQPILIHIKTGDPRTGFLRPRFSGVSVELREGPDTFLRALHQGSVDPEESGLDLRSAPLFPRCLWFWHQARLGPHGKVASHQPQSVSSCR